MICNSNNASVFSKFLSCLNETFLRGTEMFRNMVLQYLAYLKHAEWRRIALSHQLTYVSNETSSLIQYNTKRGQQNLGQYLTLFCDTNALMSGWMEVVVILKKFLRCWSENFYLTFLFLYFINENSCSQVYIWTDSEDVNQTWLWSKEYFCWEGRSQKSSKET